MTALSYHVVSGGADTNSGTTTGTSPLANGTAATRSGAVYTLDGTPDLSGVTANQDTIRITGETSGRGSDGTLFEITAVDDGADTVTVDPTPTGGTSGLTWAIGGGLATVQQVMDDVDAGDTIYIEAGTYTETVDIKTAGTSTAPIKAYPYTTTPGDGLGWVTIDGTGNNSCLTDTPSFGYYKFTNFIFENANFAGAQLAGAYAFVECKFRNNGGSGILVSSYSSIVNCESYGNASLGASLSQSHIHFCGNKVYNNTQVAIDCNGQLRHIFYKNVFAGNDTATGQIKEIGDDDVFIANAFDNNGDANPCLAMNTGEWVRTLVDNVFYDGSYAITGHTSAGIEEIMAYIGHNLVNGMSSGNYNLTGANIFVESDLGHNDVTTAPAFFDEANYDLRPTNSSGMVDTGLTPGCHKSE